MLTIAPNDIKSLFRRSQALEKLGKTEDAYKDIKTLLYIDPKVLVALVKSLHICWSYSVFA